MILNKCKVSTKILSINKNKYICMYVLENSNILLYFDKISATLVSIKKYNLIASKLLNGIVCVNHFV